MAPLLIIGAALGGTAMYFFDPDRGRRRRALVRDKAIKAESCVRDFVDAGTRDLAGRGAALTGRVRSTFTRRKESDQVLVERVRSKMGRHVGHPGAVTVSASDRHVTLSGPVLAHEHEELLEAVRAVHGVEKVIDQLSVFETAEGISTLQGSRAPKESNGLRPSAWGPGTQLLAGGAATWFLLRRSASMRALVALAAGTAVVLRMMSKEPPEHLTSTSAAEPGGTPQSRKAELEENF